ncbi:MAG: hypothetical protein KDK53_16810 [Maritimibacter sp.]|nr:hypothetical protein [Maritimibacter sp.]
MHMINEVDQEPAAIARNLTSEGLRSDLAAIASRFRMELKGLAEEGLDGLLAAVLDWLERAEMRDPEIGTAQSLLRLTDLVIALRNSRLAFTPRRTGGSVVVELVGDRGGAVPVDALRYAVCVAVSRHDPVLGASLAQRADETHRRHIAEMTALLST